MIKKTQTYHRTNRRKLIVTPCNWRSEGANHPWWRSICPGLAGVGLSW